MKFLILLCLLFVGQAFADTPYKFISAGESHSCVASNTDVVCWGGNYYGQGEITRGFKNIRKLYSYKNGNCVLEDEGTWCWGENNENKFKISGADQYDELGMGYFHLCALKDGKPTCFGSNTVYGLHAIPADLSNAKNIVATVTFSCVLVEDKVQCWGKHAPPKDLGPVKELVSGTYEACAVTVQNKVVCWGETNWTTLYLPEMSHITMGASHLCGVVSGVLKCWKSNGSEFPTPSLKADDFTALTSGDYHTCALTKNGPLCWGNNSSGQVSNFPPTLKNIDQLMSFDDTNCFKSQVTSQPICLGVQNSFLIQHFSTVKDPSNIAANYGLGCVIINGNVKCAGTNASGFNIIPRDIINPTAVTVGKDFGCVLAEPLGIRCWGDNFFGQANPPFRPKNPRSLTAGQRHACLISDDGVECWGDNEAGQLNVPNTNSPAIKVVSGESFSCLLNQDKEIKCWGKRSFSETDTEQMSFQPKDILAGSNFLCAHDENHIACFGDNSLNQLLVPSKVKNIKQVSLGANHGCLLDDYGVQCWGSNKMGQNNFLSSISE